MAKRTIRGGIVLAECETRDSFLVSVYHMKTRVAHFRVDASEAEAVQAGFVRAARHLKSYQHAFPRRGFKESDYCVTIRPQRISCGREEQRTHADLRNVSGDCESVTGEPWEALTRERINAGSPE